jgi:hypothetical protein
VKRPVRLLCVAFIGAVLSCPVLSCPVFRAWPLLVPHRRRVPTAWRLAPTTAWSFPRRRMPERWPGDHQGGLYIESGATFVLGSEENPVNTGTISGGVHARTYEGRPTTPNRPAGTTATPRTHRAASRQHAKQTMNDGIRQPPSRRGRPGAANQRLLTVNHGAPRTTKPAAPQLQWP